MSLVEYFFVVIHYICSYGCSCLVWGGVMKGGGSVSGGACGCVRVCGCFCEGGGWFCVCER
jgi:hypothetical protein